MWAYSGVSGQLLDENGNPWLHGGEVYVLTNTESYWDYQSGYAVRAGLSLFGTGTIDSNGSFAFDWGEDEVGNGQVVPYPGQFQPDDAILSIVIMPHAGPNGTPPTQEYRFNNYRQLSQRYHLGSVTSQTGPNVVTLSDAPQAASILPVSSDVALLALLAFALGVMFARLGKRKES